MPREPNARPAGTPKVPGRLVQGIGEAIADPARRPNAYIRLIASGGVHSEEYDFEFRIDASGNITSHLRDELYGRHRSDRVQVGQQADPERFRSLARAIDLESLVRLDYQARGFPPDSVVGRLEVGDGEQSASFTFLADDAQAAEATTRTPDPLRRAVDAVYAAAAAYLGDDNLKPSYGTKPR
jgi:hypothetical protein